MYKIRKPLFCPYCFSSSVISEMMFIKENVEKLKDYVGTPFIQETYSVMYKCYCPKCSRLYNVDFGKSSYTRYVIPLDMTCINDIKLLADFTSDSERNFKIYIACNNENVAYREKYKNIYYMELEEDHYPVFITQEQAEEFLTDITAARNFVYNIWMNRYR